MPKPPAWPATSFRRRGRGVVGVEALPHPLLLGFGLPQVAPEGLGERTLDHVRGAAHLHQRLFLDRVDVGQVLDELGLGIVVWHDGQLPRPDDRHASEVGDSCEHRFSGAARRNETRKTRVTASAEAFVHWVGGESASWHNGDIGVCARSRTERRDERPTWTPQQGRRRSLAGCPQLQPDTALKRDRLLQRVRAARKRVAPTPGVLRLP